MFILYRILFPLRLFFAPRASTHNCFTQKIMFCVLLTCCISASGLSQICYGQRHGEKHSTLYNLRQAFEGCTFVQNNIIINAGTLHDGSLSFLSRIVQVNGYVSIEGRVLLSLFFKCLTFHFMHAGKSFVCS